MVAYGFIASDDSTHTASVCLAWCSFSTSEPCSVATVIPTLVPPRAAARPNEITIIGASDLSWRSSKVIVALAIVISAALAVAAAQVCELDTLRSLTDWLTTHATTALVVSTTSAALVAMLTHVDAPANPSMDSPSITSVRGNFHRVAESRGGDWKKAAATWSAMTGAAVLASLLGLKVVSARFGREPSVLFVGSGTVDRFLFTGNDHLVSMAGDPFRVSGRQVWPWSLESTSGSGLNVLTSSYVHHADFAREESVPVIAMTSSHIYRSDGYRLMLLHDRSLPRSVSDNVPGDAPTIFLPVRLGATVDVTTYGLNPSQMSSGNVNVECAHDGLLFRDLQGAPIPVGQSEVVLAVGSSGSATGELCPTQPPSARQTARTNPDLPLPVLRRVDWALDYRNLVRFTRSGLDLRKSLLVALGSEVLGDISSPYRDYVTGRLVDHEGLPILRDYALALTAARRGDGAYEIDENRCIALFVVRARLPRDIQVHWDERLEFDSSEDEFRCSYSDEPGATWVYVRE